MFRSYNVCNRDSIDYYNIFVINRTSITPMVTNTSRSTKTFQTFLYCENLVTFSVLLYLCITAVCSTET